MHQVQSVHQRYAIVRKARINFVNVDAVASNQLTPWQRTPWQRSMKSVLRQSTDLLPIRMIRFDSQCVTSRKLTVTAYILIPV